jgi:hypothetical protein
MKQLKSIFALVLMSMFVNVSYAQDSTTKSPATLTAEEVTAIKNALTSNSAKAMGMLPSDSTYFMMLLENGNTPLIADVEQAGVLGKVDAKPGDEVKVFIIKTSNGFDLYYDVVRKTTKVVKKLDLTSEQQLDSARVQTRFIEQQHEGSPRYRTEYEFTRHDGSKGTITKKAMDKYGFSILAGGNYQMGSDLNAFSGELGLSFSISDKSGRLFLNPEVVASLRRTMFNANANEAGEKYWSYGTEGTLFGGVALGKHGDHRIALGAGLGWEFYSTDSQARYYEDGSWDEMSSKGNYLYPQFKLRYEWDGYNNRVGVFGGIGVRQHKSVWQNADAESTWMPTFELGVKVKIFRNTTSF